MSGMALKIGQHGPHVDACQHEQESGTNGTSSDTTAGRGAAPGAATGNSHRLSQLGLDANQDGDGGILETAALILGSSIPGMSSMLGTGADYVEEAVAVARFEAFRGATHSVNNYAFQGWGNFDLDYTPASGTVIVSVRVKFDFIDGTPSPGDNAADYVWTDEAKEAWKVNFMTSVERTWSGQHGFRCETSDAELQQSPRWEDLTPSVVIDMVERDDDHHFAVTVEKIPANGFARSSVGRPSRDASGNVTSPGSASLDSEDMRPTVKGTSPAGVTQRGAVHEFGHMIGLQDEYTSSPDRVGDETRQGTQKGMDDNASIMSGGEVVEQAHYSSILEALNVAVSGHDVRFGFA